MTGAVRLERAGGVARITLDQPARRNAMTGAMWRALQGLVEEAAGDDSVAVTVVEGAGEHFCGGADIAEFAETYATAEGAARANAAIAAAVEALAACAKPTVAVVRGACVGGGVALALACDLRLARADARFAVTPAKLGLLYSHGDTIRLVRAVGAARAKEMLFSARVVGAEEALKIGLVQRTMSDAEVAEYVDALARGSRTALRGIKRMVGAVEEGVFREMAELRGLFEEAFAGEDFREGYAAFLEKRAPVFKAR